MALALLLVAAALPSQSSWASGARAKSGNFDLWRAHTKVPGDHVRASGHANMVAKVNAHLSASAFRVRACENFTVPELVELQRYLHARRDPALEAVYAAARDNRRMAAFGARATAAADLEALWAAESGLLAQHPELARVSRDAKCHEAVMWMVHHLTQEAQAAVRDLLWLPLLPVGEMHGEHDHSASPAVDQVLGAYRVATGCAACHASGSGSGNTEAAEWPAELTYSATAHGAFPFWDNSGPGCSECNPSVSTAAQLKVKYSATLNSEVLMHSNCGDMSWTGGAGAPKNSPCNHIFTPDEGAFIYTPSTSLEQAADGKFCCRSYAAKDTSFPGAVPKDWMRSMAYKGTKSGFKGEHYSGDVKVYTASTFGLQFWYFESADGRPVEQGEGCTQPGDDPAAAKKACAKMLPIMLWHDYDPATFKAASFSKTDFTVPDVCKTTTTSCSAPGGSSGPSPSPSPSPSPGAQVVV